MNAPAKVIHQTSMERSHGEIPDEPETSCAGSTQAIAHRGSKGWYIAIEHYPVLLKETATDDAVKYYGPEDCFPQRPNTSLALLWNTNIWSCVSPLPGCTLHVFDSSGSRMAVIDIGSHTAAPPPPRLSRSAAVNTVHPDIFCASVRDVVLNPIEVVVIINAQFVLPVRMSVRHFSMMLESYHAKAIIVTQEGLQNVQHMLVNCLSKDTESDRLVGWPDNTIFVDDESDETISLILFNTSKKLEGFSSQANKPDVYIQFPRNIYCITKKDTIDAGSTYLRIRGIGAYERIEVYLFDSGNDDANVVPSFTVSSDDAKILCGVFCPSTENEKRIASIHLAAYAVQDPIGFLGTNVNTLLQERGAQSDPDTKGFIGVGMEKLQHALQHVESIGCTNFGTSRFFRETSVHWQM
jgi:hypothetical protein